MEFQRPLFLLLVLFSLLSSSKAHKFYVGGNDGWVPNPSEDYNQWAGRNRFQVNDILVFKYNKGSDSVLEVTKEDYDKCNKTNPIKKFDDGDTEFKFDRTGPFYFISGKDGNCEKGQKLIVVVLSVRGQQQHGPPPKETPSPVSHPPVAEPPQGGGGGVAPVSPFPNPPSASRPASPPTTLSPSGNPPSSSVSPSPAKVNRPSTSPSRAPGLSPTSPSPVSSPPVVSPALANAPSVPSPASTPPAVSPGTANAPSVPSPGSAPVPATTPPPSPSPFAPTPPAPSPTTTSPSPSTAHPPAPTPSSASSNATAPSPPTGGSSARAVTPSNFLLYSVTVMLGAALSSILGRN